MSSLKNDDLHNLRVFAAGLTAGIVLNVSGIVHMSSGVVIGVVACRHTQIYDYVLRRAYAVWSVLPLS